MSVVTMVVFLIIVPAILHKSEIVLTVLSELNDEDYLSACIMPKIASKTVGLSAAFVNRV